MVTEYPDISKYRVVDLKELCAEYGLSVTGRKADLQQRLREYFEGCRGKIEKADHPDNVCVICYEQWTNVGPHGLSSLPCGHLFGFKCIQRWLSQASTCPECNKPSKAADIRKIRARNLTAVDNSNEVSLRREMETLSATNKQLIAENAENLLIIIVLFFIASLSFLMMLYFVVTSLLLPHFDLW
jgi:hypothetical protein